MRLIILPLIISLAVAQWNLIQRAGPGYLSTGPQAHPITPLALKPAFWNLGGTNLMLLEEQRMWFYELDSGRWLWQPDVTIPPRVNAAVWENAHLFGGESSSGSLLNDLYHYNPSLRSFEKLVGGTICNFTASWSHLASSSLYFWGCKTLHLYNTSTGRWSTPSVNGNPPDTPYGAAFVRGNNVFLYVTNEFWHLNLETYAWTFLNISDAGPRTFPLLWAGEESDSVILYGGRRNSLILRDTWEWRNFTRKWVLLEDNTGPRTLPTLAQGEFGDGLYFIEGDGTLWRYGPTSYIPHFDPALLAAVMSTLIFSFLVLISLFLLVRRCVRAKKSQRTVALLRDQMDESL